MIALGAAAVAWRVAERQIRQTKELAEKQRVAKLKAARAVLPGALSQISSYSQECVYLAMDIREWGRSNGAGERPPYTPKAAMPILNGDVIISIKECIEFASTPEEVDALRCVLTWAQVQLANLSSLYRYAINPNANGVVQEVPEVTAPKSIVYAGIVRALAGKLYEYARQGGNVSFSPLERDEVENALTLCHVQSLACQDVKKQIDVCLQKYRKVCMPNANG